MAKRDSTAKIVEDLLNNIFGNKDSHRTIADELVIKYNDARGSLTSVLRYLKYYQEEDLL